MKTVTSSNIAAYGYDPEQKVLTVLFKTGAKYQYHQVSPQDYQELEAATSVGKHIARYYRGGKFKVTKSGEAK